MLIYPTAPTPSTQTQEDGFLTHREIQILGLSAEGLTSKEIGDRIFLSVNTIETYRKSMLKKTGAGNVVQLVAKAIRSGWIR